ncbi:MAG: hypothetical protein QF463_10895 [Vicinamibacterales bacterium]|nr:hypothetical protein [Vicinamibacterales bacterium]
MQTALNQDGPPSGPSTPDGLQVSVDEVERTAERVLASKRLHERPFLQRLLPTRAARRPHCVHRFIRALDRVRASQPNRLSPEMLEEIRSSVEAVVGRLEDEIAAKRPGPKEGAMMATIIYKTTERYEGILAAADRENKPAERAAGRL